MNDVRIAMRWVLVIALLVCCGSGALIAKKKKVEPAFLDESFSAQNVQEIVVLPALDLRKDSSIEVAKLDEIGRKAAEKVLKKRRYGSLFRADYGNVTSVTEDDVESMDPEWVGRLGGDEDRWVLLLILEDLVTIKGQAAFTARCSGHLIDRSEAKAMWRHEATESEGTVGLGALMAKKLVRSGTVSHCFERLLETLPDR